MSKQINNFSNLVGGSLYEVINERLNALCPYGSRFYTECAHFKILIDYRDNGIRVKRGTLEIGVECSNFGDGYTLASEPIRKLLVSKLPSRCELLLMLFLGVTL